MRRTDAELFDRCEPAKAIRFLADTTIPESKIECDRCGAPLPDYAPVFFGTDSERCDSSFAVHVTVGLCCFADEHRAVTERRFGVATPTK